MGREHLFVCQSCLQAIESHEGSLVTRTHWIDIDEDNSQCDWCEDDGFDTYTRYWGDKL